jgi:cell division transport system permease protein
LNWAQAQYSAFLQALHRLAAKPLNTLLSMLGIGIVLALPAGGYLFLGHVATLALGATATPQLTVFLPVDADRPAAQAIEARLRPLPGVANIQLLAREDTLARMKSAAGLADVIGALPKNPFPDALVVTPADDAPNGIDALAATIRQWRGVEHVQVDVDWARRLAAIIRLANTGGLLLAILFGVGLIAIVFNTLHLQAETRRADSERNRLAGATDTFIRQSFHWHGVLLGFAGGLTAWLVVAGAILWLRAPVAELASLYGIDFVPVLPGAMDSALLFGIAALLGWLGAALAIGQQLRHLEKP